MTENQKLQVNKEKLQKYLKNSYRKAFDRDFDEGGLNYWVSMLNENLRNSDERQAVVSTVNRMIEANELKGIINDLGVSY